MDGVLERRAEDGEQLGVPRRPCPLRGPVLVGYDGSEPARRAVLWAARRAALWTGAGAPSRLVVLTAGGSEQVRGPGGGDPLGRLRARELAEEGASLVREAVDLRLRRTGRREVLVRTGRPADALVAASRAAALVVVGSRGRGAPPGSALGEVSTAVASRAACPVVVVHGEEVAEPEPDQPVVVAADGTPASAAAVAFASDEAAHSGAPLLVVTAWEPGAQATWTSAVAAGQGPDPAGLGAAQSASLAHALAAAQAARRRHRDLRVSTRVLAGPAAAALVGAADGASVLVLGSRGLARHLEVVRGSVSAAVARRVACPVVVVKAPGAPDPAADR